MAPSSPLGIKRPCPACSARFYDLNKTPATCPKCGHSFDPAALNKPRRTRRVSLPAAASGEEDALAAHLARTRAGIKPKAAAKGEAAEGFGSGAQDMEEIEEMDDLEVLGELENIEEEDDDMDDDITLDEDDVGDNTLIDSLEEVEQETFESTEEDSAPKRPAPAKVKKPAKKR